MKTSHLSVLSSLLAAAFLAGCATGVVNDDPDPTPEHPQTVKKTLTFNIASNNYTRATKTGADESTISNLYLAFFKTGTSSDTFVTLKEAKVTGTTFELEIEADPFNLPDKVVAYANISDATKGLLEAAFKDGTYKSLAVSDLFNGDYMTMSSAVYFDTQTSETKLIEGTTLTSANYTGKTVDIYLERIGAKLSVINDAKNLTISPILMDYDNWGEKIIETESFPMNLTLDSWGVVFTDESTYLLKHTNDKNSEHPSWNDFGSKTLHWARSVNYSTFDLTSITSKTIADITNKFTTTPAVEYLHETTRSDADLEKSKSSAAIVITGRYKFNGNSTDYDNIPLYRILSNDGKDRILFDLPSKGYEDDDSPLWKWIAQEQGFLYAQNGNLYTQGLKDELVMKTPDEAIAGKKIPSNYVCPQCKYSSNSKFYDASTSERHKYSVDELNKLLYEQIGLFEVYDKGSCYFIVPIEHKWIKEGGSNNDVAKAIVRNHSYTLTIKGITGFGKGVSSNSDEITDEIMSAVANKEYTVSGSISVNDWTDVNQEVNIPKQ